MSPSLVLAAKAVVTAALIGWLVVAADWDTLLAKVMEADGRWIGIAIALHILAFVASSVRWWIVLRHVAPLVRYPETVPSFYLGLFANNFLPGATGLDVARILGMRRSGLPVKPVVAAVFVERILGLATVVAIGAGAVLVWAPRWIEATAVVMSLLILSSIVMIALIFTPLSDAAGRWLQRSFQASVFRHAGDVLISIGQFRAARFRVLLALGLTVVIQSLVVLSYASLGEALESQMQLVGYFVAVPLVFVLSSLPISIGGLGVREGGFVAIMIAAGMNEQTAIGISLLFLFQWLMLTLPGGLVLIGRLKRTRPRP